MSQKSDLSCLLVGGWGSRGQTSSLSQPWGRVTAGNNTFIIPRLLRLKNLGAAQRDGSGSGGLTVSQGVPMEEAARATIFSRPHRRRRVFILPQLGLQVGPPLPERATGQGERKQPKYKPRVSEGTSPLSSAMSFVRGKSAGLAYPRECHEGLGFREWRRMGPFSVSGLPIGCLRADPEAALPTSPSFKPSPATLY